MRQAPERTVVATAIALSIAVGSVACAATPEDMAADRQTTLSNYIQSEQRAMVDLISTMDHLYSSGNVMGAFNGDTSAEDFPPVVVTFTYTYVEQVVFDHDSPGEVKLSWVEFRLEAELAEMQTRLLQACYSSVIPAMREAGLDGPLTVQYVYLNPGFIRDSWDATCSD
jgi:hypothetical protein